MPVETRQQQQQGTRESPRVPGSQSSTGPRQGLPQHFQRQLLKDIEESGEGIAGFRLNTIFSQKPDTYRLFQSKEKRKQVQNKLNKWRSLAPEDYYQLLCESGVRPNCWRNQESEEEEQEQEEPTPTPPARQHHQLPPRSPSPTRSIIMSTPNRIGTPNHIGTPNRSISDMKSQMTSKCQSSSFFCSCDSCFF